MKGKGKGVNRWERRYTWKVKILKWEIEPNTRIGEGKMGGGGKRYGGFAPRMGTHSRAGPGWGGDEG